MNILLITSDQQHWNTLGVLNPQIQTPALDKLASQGTVYTRAYCPNPTCTPTRASLITGKYPSQHGAYALGTKLPEGEPTVGELFQKAGYHTALVGKAHFQPLVATDDFPSLEAYPVLQDLDFWREFKGPFYGFSHIELARNHTDEAHVGQHYALWMEEKGLTNWRDHFRKPTGTQDPQQHKWSLPEDYHYNAWIAERTNALMSQYAENDEPFFLWASFFDPHPSYLVPEPWDTLYDPANIDVPGVKPGEHDANPPHFGLTQQTDPDFSAWQEPNGNNVHGFHSHLRERDALAKDIAVYYGMVSCMDKYIGQIIDHLDALGLREETLIVFTSDHGHFYGQHGLIAKGPFHYEDVIRVPMIVSQPGKVEAGAQSDALQSLVDYAPSFLAACGMEIPDDMTGIDQSEVWFGEHQAARDHVTVENHHQPTTVHLKTYIDQRYKITVYYQQDYGEIFDLETDPYEVNNLWSSDDLRAELTYRLLLAEIEKEELLVDPDLPQKAVGMYIKTYAAGRYEITVNPDERALYDLEADPDRETNLWDDPAYAEIRTRMIRALLDERMKHEPLWMPRIYGA